MNRRFYYKEENSVYYWVVSTLIYILHGFSYRIALQWEIFIKAVCQFILAVDSLKVYSQLMKDYAIMTKFLVDTIIKCYSKLVLKEEFDGIIKCTQPKL